MSCWSTLLAPPLLQNGWSLQEESLTIPPWNALPPNTRAHTTCTHAHTCTHSPLPGFPSQHLLLAELANKTFQIDSPTLQMEPRQVNIHLPRRQRHSQRRNKKMCLSGGLLPPHPETSALAPGGFRDERCEAGLPRPGHFLGGVRRGRQSTPGQGWDPWGPGESR